MIAQEYVPLAERTCKELPTFRQHMIHMSLGVAGEFGELLDAVKKGFVYGKDNNGTRVYGLTALDRVNIVEECGDALWYIANLCSPLEVDPSHMQRALDRGYVMGVQIQQQRNPDKDLNLGELCLALNKDVAEQASALVGLTPDMAGSFVAVMHIEKLTASVGILAGLVGIDLEQSMERNIAKLFKRYGEKYSDVAAEVRDLIGERDTLEGKS